MNDVQTKVNLPQKVNPISNFVGKFDGYKTLIAAVCMYVAIFLTEVVVGIWDVKIEALPMVIKTLNWTGLALGGVGLGHKGVKQAMGTGESK